MSTAPTVPLAAELQAAGLDADGARQAAACWAHTALVLLWLEDRGLMPTRIRAGRPLAAEWARGVEVLASHPATVEFTDPTVNPGAAVKPSAGAAAAIAGWLGAGPDLGWDTWPVGDAYQALSVQAVKGRALVQTPRFVADLLVDLSVRRAMLDLGDRARDVRVIDPACGTGHLLLASLARVTGLGRAGSRWAWDAVDSVRGVDLDPYAALVARWRLAVACLPGVRPASWAGLDRDLPIHVTAADSLLGDDPLLARGQYDAVVANPPYITVKDRAVREAIRAAYRTVCHGQYSLSIPFTVLLHELARPGGWVAQITGNSFMKREFGRPLIETYLPTVDLRWIIDTSGAYIPGHGTPTVIMASRNQPPSCDTVHVVLGKRGEAKVPADPARGEVWTDIARGVERVESAERFAFAAERAARETQPAPAPAAPVVSRPVQTDLFEGLAS